MPLLDYLSGRRALYPHPVIDYYGITRGKVGGIWQRGERKKRRDGGAWGRTRKLPSELTTALAAKYTNYQERAGQTHFPLHSLQRISSFYLRSAILLKLTIRR